MAESLFTEYIALQPPANVLKQNLTAKLSNAGFAEPADISQSLQPPHDSFVVKPRVSKAWYRPR